MADPVDPASEPIRARKPIGRRSTSTGSARRRPRGTTGRRVTERRGAAVDELVRQVRLATPLQRVEIERRGVAGQVVNELARRLGVPAVRVFAMIGVPKATAQRKALRAQVIAGSGGQSAIGMAQLLGIAHAMMAQSTASEARDFDAERWLGRWLERPQAALGGRTPGELLDTPTGIAVVSRLLGAIESGAYQ